MICRILLVLFFLCCGIQSASAGVITTDLNIDLNAAVSGGGMSTPVDHNEGPSIQDDDGDYQMTGVNAGQSSTTAQATIPTGLVIVFTRPSSSRLRLANASLPNSPISDGLLKPS